MKNKWRVMIVASVFMLIMAWGQTVMAIDGGTGADGALNVPASTTVEIQLPESGELHYTSVIINSGATVKFKKNTKNTPVTIYSQGDVTIHGTINLNGSDSTGKLIIPGLGGPGGFDGGKGGGAQKPGANGEGPGGGMGGAGGTIHDCSAGNGGGGGFGKNGTKSNYCTLATPYPEPGLGGSIYSNEQILPAIGGSGGGGGGGSKSYSATGGGGGGGAIVISTPGTITVNNSITANGGTAGGGEWYSCGGGGGGGSGGSIRLIANTIAGNGTISVSGGTGGDGCNDNAHRAGGAPGRIRFEYVTLLRTYAVTPTDALSLGPPSAVRPTSAPSLTITKVAGQDAPSVPGGFFSSPDITLPFNTPNDITVVVTGTSIPEHTIVTLKATPSVGAATSGTGEILLQADGTTLSASIPITISKVYPSVLTASVTFQTASLGIGPIYAQGELVEKVRVETAMGGKSTVIYITKSGKEIPAKDLKS